MGIVAMQLDKVRVSRSLASDRAVAKAFHVTAQTVSMWRSGDAYPDEDKIAQLAELAGDDPGELLVRVRIERSSGKAREAWVHNLARLGIPAVLALATLPAMAGHFAYPGLVIIIM